MGWSRNRGADLQVRHLLALRERPLGPEASGAKAPPAMGPMMSELKLRPPTDGQEYFELGHYPEAAAGFGGVPSRRVGPCVGWVNPFGVAWSAGTTIRWLKPAGREGWSLAGPLNHVRLALLVGRTRYPGRELHSAGACTLNDPGLELFSIREFEDHVFPVDCSLHGVADDHAVSFVFRS